MTTENKEKINGLVLGGGGSRGCYEVGAWQAFEECGLHFECVSGTSIGAIIGALYTQGRLEDAIDFVYSLEPSNIVKNMPDIPENWDEVITNREILFRFLRDTIKDGTDISPLKKSLEKIFNYERFENSKINYACMTFNVSQMKGEAFFKKDMNQEDALAIIIASASCYPAFPMANINGTIYIDGGFEDNIPINLCEEMGADEFVIVDVHGPGRVHPITTDAPYKIIQPLLQIANFLDFSKDQAIRSYRIGYLETMKYYNRYCGYLFTFDQSSWPTIFMVDRYLKLKIHNQIPENAAEKAYPRILGYKPYPLDNDYNNQDYFYGRLIEILAFVVNMDPVKLYDYKDFLKELDRRLSELPEIAVPNSFMAIHEFIHSRKKEEVIHLFHHFLVHNQGKLPLLYEPLKNMFDTQYYLALVWYEMHLYLQKLR